MGKQVGNPKIEKIYLEQLDKWKKLNCLDPKLLDVEKGKKGRPFGSLPRTKQAQNLNAVLWNIEKRSGEEIHLADKKLD